MFHSKSVEESLSLLKTSKEGLSDEEAALRSQKDGKNKLNERKKTPLIVKFINQFKDVMIIVLICAAIISAGVAIFNNEPSELLDSGIIMLIVIINAVIGLIQESKAEKAIEALKNLNKPFCKVRRSGEVKHIKSEDLVVGDIVILEAGDMVPADLRLIETSSLKTEESALTGESLPSEKSSEDILKENAPIGDRKNVAFSGSTVSYGRGEGVVYAIGMNTEMGKIADMLSGSDNSSTPLQKQLSKTAKILSVIVLIIAAIIFACSIIKGSPLIVSFMTAVAIAVAAIPEGLPAIITILLALGVSSMSKKKAIVRNLPAVETLGSCEVICTDKTGTLTLNKMTVKKIFTFDSGLISSEDLNAEGDGDLLIKGMTLCNDTFISEGSLAGDPTETALVSFAIEKGYNFDKLKKENKRVYEIPFDSVRKLMTTVNKSYENETAYIKGAPDILATQVKKILSGGEIKDATKEDIEKIKKANETLAQNAMRVLAVAYKQENLDKKSDLEKDLIFIGLIGMIDPPRKEVKNAVSTCVKAGIKPVMITGDHLITASAIAKEIGILKSGDKIMEGVEIDAMTDEEFESIIESVSVFARVSPENKVRIVKAFKSKNKVVAMTGDGVNDAPSIKEADIGIGMGITGTDVSKSASDMILADDNFATIVSAVEEGRNIFANMKRAIQFLLSANIAEVLCLFIATTFLLSHGQLFLTPVMILWINLVTDSFPALALGVEKAEKDVMSYPPRKSDKSLFAGRTGVDIVIEGLIQTALVMSVYVLGSYVLKTTHEQAMTMAFISLCFIQLFHSYNMRSLDKSIFSGNPLSNKWLNYSFILGAILVLAVTLIPPIATAFGCESLTLTSWLVSIGLSLAVIPLVEIQKAIERKIFK